MINRILHSCSCIIKFIKRAGEKDKKSLFQPSCQWPSRTRTDFYRTELCRGVLHDIYTTSDCWKSFWSRLASSSIENVLESAFLASSKLESREDSQRIGAGEWQTLMKYTRWNLAAYTCNKQLSDGLTPEATFNMHKEIGGLCWLKELCFRLCFHGVCVCVFCFVFSPTAFVRRAFWPDIWKRLH